MPNTSLTLDPQSTALVLIDLQKGITAMQTAPLATDVVISNAKKLKDAFNQKGMFVVLVRVTGAADGKDMLRPNADETIQMSGPRPKDWADIVPELEANEKDYILTKRQWGAFYGTELDLELRRRGIKTIVIGGIATNMGVESTARDAYERSYDLVFASDAMAGRAAEDHTFALTKIFPRIGRVRDVEAILKALS